MIIVAFGDSVTKGLSSPDLRESNRWTSILERILRDWMGRDVRVVNSGVRGDTASQALKRIEEDVLKYTPDLTLLMFGLNDARKESVGKYEEATRRIIHILKEHDIDVILMTPNPATERYKNPKMSPEEIMAFRRDVREIAERARKIANEEKIVLIDMFRLFEENRFLWDTICDGAHPSLKAQGIMASYIAKGILEHRGVHGFPEINILGIKKVYGDGLHNAFTDIERFNRRYYIVFRHGENHVRYDREPIDYGKIYLIKSLDLEDWRLKKVFSMKGWDLRDPKIVGFKGRLFLYIASTKPSSPPPEPYEFGKAVKERVTFCFHSDDGENWEGPVKCGDGIFWRPLRLGDRMQVVRYIRRGKYGDPNSWQIDLMESEDGLKWRLLKTLYKGDKANETALVRVDKHLFAFARRRWNMRMLKLEQIDSEENQWRHMPLDRIIQGPDAVEVDGRIIVMGRFFTVEGEEGWEEDFREMNKYDVVRTGCFLIEEDKAKLIFEFPSGGDCSYPGILKEGETLNVSYYSGHPYSLEENVVKEYKEKKFGMTDIYLARLQIFFK